MRGISVESCSVTVDDIPAPEKKLSQEAAVARIGEMAGGRYSTD